MKTRKNSLLIHQLDKKTNSLSHLESVATPANGWIQAVRKAINMSLRQLGERLNITPQSVRTLETREAAGTITLDTLQKAAAALNMKVVYGLVPIDGSIEQMIEHRARALATTIVKRTNVSMILEGQENTAERLNEAIEELTDELKREMPKYLWD